MIDYTITVTNADTGSTGPATDVVVTDPVPANTTFANESIDPSTTTGLVITDDTPAGGPPSWTIPTLDVDQQAVFNVEVTTDAKGPTTSSVYAYNTASVSWTDPGDGLVSTTPSFQVATQIDLPSISVVKSAADPDGLPVTNLIAGQIITYSYVVTNTGNVALDPISVTDPMPGLSAISCPATSLAVDASMTCTATYSVTSADVNAAAAGTTLNNTATVSGNPPVCADGSTSCPVTDTSTVKLPEAPAPALSVTKVASVDTPSTWTVGTVIDYTVIATNTGNITLNNVTVSDPKVTSLACDANAAALIPGESTTCMGIYTLTQADVDAKQLDNTASANATPIATPDDPNPTQIPDVQASTTVLPPSGDPQTDARAVGQPKDFNPSGANLKASTVNGVQGTFVYADTTADTSGLPSTVTVTVDPSTGVVTATGSVPGVYEIPVTYTDSNGLQVTVINTLTVIGPDKTSTPVNTPVTPPGLVPGTNLPSNNDLTFTGPIKGTPGYPAHGDIVINSDGTYTYTPANGFSGVDHLTYTACLRSDPKSCAQSTVTITVIPKGSDDTATTQPDTPVAVNVLGNDPAGPSLTVKSVTQPSNGTDMIGANGMPVYTPNPGFAGVDTFTYTACDNTTPTPQCVTQTVTVTVPASPVVVSGGSANTGGGVTGVASLAPMLFALLLAAGGAVVVWRRRLGRDTVN